MARRQVSIFINGKEVANQIKSISSEKRKLMNEINNLTIGTAEYEAKVKDLQKLNKIIDEHKNTIGNVESSWTKIKGGALQFAGAMGIAYGVQEIVKFGAELFKLGTEMETLTKKAETVLGEALPLVNAQAEKNANQMGLTTQQYINQTAALADLLIPMKFSREEAANISTELVNLSGALSEWTGGQLTAEAVTDRLGDAILGEYEGLKQLGITIDAAEVKTRLAEKGLKGLTGEMQKQAEAAVVLELVTEKSVDAQTAYANSSDSLVRNQAELRAKFVEIKEAMATALIPVFHRLMEVAAPIIENFSDLIIAMLKGESATGKLSGGMKIVATILGNVGNLVKFVWEAFTGLARFMLNNFGPVIQVVGSIMLGLYNGIVATINGIGELTGIEARLKPINVDDFKKSLEDVKNSLNSTKIEPTLAASSSNPSKEALFQQAAAQEESKKLAEKATNDRIKQAEKEEKELEDRAKRLNEAIAKIKEEGRIQSLSEEDKKIAELASKYDAQIKEAIELEKKKVKGATEQRLALERLKEEAVVNLQNQLFDEEMARLAEKENVKTLAELEIIRQREETKRAAEVQIATEIQEIVLSERAQALLDLEQHLLATLALANQHGIDTFDIELAFRQKKSQVIKEFDEKDKAEMLKRQKAQAEAIAAAFSAAGSLVSGVISALGAKAKETTALGKVLALTQIGISSAEAIAKGTAAASGVPFPGNLIAIATTVGTVLANIGQARKILAATETPQKKDGGWHNVTGATDGVSYQAKYIGSTGTGLLPSHPVVLASEAGAEYFVSNRDLHNPYVLDHVRAIENLSGNRTPLPQFQEGGFTSGSVPQPASENVLLVAVLTQLSSKIDRMYARIDDNTIVDLQERYAEISEASGGVI